MPRPPVYGFPLGHNATLGAHNGFLWWYNFHYSLPRGAIIPQSHLSRLLLEVDLPAVRVEAVAEGVERQDQVETRTDKCLKW